MAKRNCRRTPEEVSIHEEAVKLRKMTDAQLVERFRAASATIEESSAKDSAKSAAEFLEAIANANVPGVGKITIKKLNTFAKGNGYV